MASIEKVLEPHSTDTPTCICRKDMRLAKIEPHAFVDNTETREFDCDCGHRIRLMVWTK